MHSYGSEEQEANSVGNDKNVNLGPYPSSPAESKKSTISKKFVRKDNSSSCSNNTCSNIFTRPRLHISRYGYEVYL